MKNMFFIVSIMILFFTGCANINLQELRDEISNKKYTSDKDVFMLILDGSGSMNDKDRFGLVKIDAAKDIIKDISLKLDPSKTNAGLVNFSNGCNSSKLLVSPNNNDFNKIIVSSQSISPSGRTPLASSIQYTGHIARNIDKNINIVIISDGEETCGGDPIFQAKELQRRFGDRINVFVIGYSVDSKIEYQLKQLVLGKGSYFDAKDGNKLNEILDSITDKLNIKDSKWTAGVYKFNINFDSASSKVKKKYIPQIKQLAQYLKNNNYKVEIQGHTDSDGKEEYNQKLSERRAKSVREELLKYGISKSRIYAIGYGELAPIAKNNTQKGKFKNRRVEAHIIKNGNLNVDLINKANFLKPVKVKYATTNSFVGYYKLLDRERTYNKYHAYVKLYANNTAYSAEFLDNEVSRSSDVIWKYNNNNQEFFVDWFSKEEYIRITKEEVECMDSKGKFINGICQ